MPPCSTPFTPSDHMTAKGSPSDPGGRRGFSCLLRAAAGVDADDVDEDVAEGEVEDVVAVQRRVDVAGGERQALAAGDGDAGGAGEQTVLVAEEPVGGGGELRRQRDRHRA